MRHEDSRTISFSLEDSDEKIDMTISGHADLETVFAAFRRFLSACGYCADSSMHISMQIDENLIYCSETVPEEEEEDEVTHVRGS